MKTRILTRVLGILEIKNSNQGRRSNNNWNTTNASSDDGVNEGSNENSDGIGARNWRSGYQGRGGLGKGGFRGRGFQGRG